MLTRGLLMLTCLAVAGTATTNNRKLSGRRQRHLFSGRRDGDPIASEAKRYAFSARQQRHLFSGRRDGDHKQ